MIRLIALRELRSLLATPATWLILAALMFILSWSYVARLDAFLQVQTQFALVANAPGVTQVVVPYLSGILALILLILTPLFTMRLFAEERRNQTIALLLTAPVSSAQIVLGKYIGLVLFLWLIALTGMLLPLTLQFGTPMDFGLLVANILGLLLLAASYAALGLYVSTLTAQPIAAALGALATLLGLWLAESAASDSYRFWHTLAPTGHLRSFTSGLLDSGDVVYFLLCCTFFLLLAVRRLNNNRRYG